MLETAPFIIALAALVAALFWIILRSSSAKIEAQYERLAKDLELELEIPKPQLAGFVRNEPAAYGSYRGREISFSAPGRGLQNTRQIETVLKIELRDKALSAHFAATGLISSLGHRESGKKARWKSGDVAFDEDVDVRCDQGERLKAVLDEERRRSLALILKTHKAKLYIGEGVIAYTEIGLISTDDTRERFEAVTEFLCDFAETVEG